MLKYTFDLRDCLGRLAINHDKGETPDSQRSPGPSPYHKTKILEASQVTLIGHSEHYGLVCQKGPVF